jgi:hypothetical protein
MRRQEFRNAGSGAYILVYQRPGEQPMLDFNFFDGDREVDEAKKLGELVERALVQVEAWRNNPETKEKNP